MKRVGLLISRCQVVHFGHLAQMQRMLRDNPVNLVGQGSAQRHGVKGNPLTAEQKTRAHNALWGPNFRAFRLYDIGATDEPEEWMDYVLSVIRQAELPEPTDLYAGSVSDARWYEGYFTPLSSPGVASENGVMIWENEKTGRRIHIMDRDAAHPFSSSLARALIEARDDRWKDMVPRALWDFYEREYPPHLRQPLDEIDPTKVYPMGTLLRSADEGRILMLRADGKWRERRVSEDAKSLGD